MFRELTWASFKNQELANVLWGYATLSAVGGGRGQQDENSRDASRADTEPAAAAAAGSIESSDADMLRLCGMALEEAANRRSSALGGMFSAQQLACVLWAGSRLGLAGSYEGSFSTLVSEATARMTQCGELLGTTPAEATSSGLFGEQELCMLLNSVAGDSKEIQATTNHFRLAGVVVLHIAGRVGEFSPQELGRLAAACSAANTTVGVHARVWSLALCSECRLKHDSFASNPAALAQILWAMARRSMVLESNTDDDHDAEALAISDAVIALIGATETTTKHEQAQGLLLQGVPLTVDLSGVQGMDERDIAMILWALGRLAAVTASSRGFARLASAARVGGSFLRNMQLALARSRFFTPQVLRCTASRFVHSSVELTPRLISTPGSMQQHLRRVSFVSPPRK